MSAEITTDCRIQELRRALNEGTLEADFVRSKLEQLVRDPVDLIYYSDGV